MVGLSDGGVAIVACIFDGYAPDDIGSVLDHAGIAVRTGLQCSPGAHRYLETLPAGTVRFSLGYFNTEDDLAALGEVLRYIQDNG